MVETSCAAGQFVQISLAHDTSPGGPRSGEAGGVVRGRRCPIGDRTAARRRGDTCDVDEVLDSEARAFAWLVEPDDEGGVGHVCPPKSRRWVLAFPEFVSMCRHEVRPIGGIKPSRTGSGFRPASELGLAALARVACVRWART